MILAADVQYEGNSAFAAGVLFQNWDSDSVHKVIRKRLDGVQDYEPGSFYKRELPCLLALLSEVDVELEAILVDGYVTLGAEAVPGLGRHLYEALQRKIPVVGVAKSYYLGTPQACELVRGTSQRPLYITVAGIPLEEAQSLVRSMQGRGRVPDLLVEVDRLARELVG